MTPGEGDRASDELRQATGALRESRLLLSEGLLEGAASRLYYAVFHAARGALTLRGLHSRTHSGLITLFIQTFGPAPVLGRLFDMRAEADYSIEPFGRAAEEIGARTAEAEEFIERCHRIVSEALAAGPDEPDPPPDL